MSSAATCHDEQRRAAVRAKHLNGIDYVEISDDQRRISVYFLDKAPQNLTLANVRISGRRRVTGIKVVDLRLCVEEDQELDDCLSVFVNCPGDFSSYTLALVNIDASGNSTNTPLDGFDPRYAQISFSFKAGETGELDCKTDQSCPPEALVEPEISYLAKDYSSFRQLLFDRLALIMPDWNERHGPDLGLTLVELLAYVGDYLSYYQDAVATEAYLDTARQRVSVRRHVRLVDYQLHEGNNARAWLTIATSDDLRIEPNSAFFIVGRDEAAIELSIAHCASASIGTNYMRREPPLVSCIMPTYNRRRFVSLAIHYFLNQDYPNRELIIVDDGEDKIADLVPLDERIRYVALDVRQNLGAKRNLACDLARGSIIIHWDDDDWSAPRRVRYQQSVLDQQHAELGVISRTYYLQPELGAAWLHAYPLTIRANRTGGTLCYRRTLWERNSFPTSFVGADWQFFQRAHDAPFVIMPDATFYIALVHGTNTSYKARSGPYWHPRPLVEIKQMMGPDWRFYATDEYPSML